MGRYLPFYDEDNDKMYRYWVDIVYVWDEETETWRLVEDDPGDADLDWDSEEDTTG